MKNNLYILLIFLTLYACEKDTDIKLSPEPIPVINCFFSPDSSFTVNLSKSIGISDTVKLNFTENAQIELFENNISKGMFTYKNTGFYYNAHNPSVDNLYRIEVMTDKNEFCTAQDILPEKTKIISIDTTHIPNPYNAPPEYADPYGELKCDIKFQDNPNTINYYLLEIKSVGGYYGYEYEDGHRDSVFYYSHTYFEYDDNIIEAEISGNINQSCYGILFSDKLINGKSHTLTVRISLSSLAIVAENNLLFYLKSVSEDYYLYALTYAQMLNYDEDLFAEPVQVFSNICGGFGIFGAYNQSVDSIKIIQKSYSVNRL